MMSIQEYNQWLHAGFFQRNGGWYPHDIAEWFNKVQDSHRDICNFLNADIICRSYNLDSLQKPIDTNVEPAKSIIDRILYIAPTFCQDYKFTRSVFEYPVASIGNHDAVKVSKMLTRYAKDYGIATEYIKELDKLLSSLGEIWAKSRTNQSSLNVTLSTTPKAFTLLGHYGPDNNSCFRQGSTSPYDKFIFGQSKNTFVVTVSKFDEKKKKDKNVARAFGWFDNNSFYIRNYYFVEGFQEGDFLAVCEKLFSELLKTPIQTYEGMCAFTNASFNNWHFYQNNYGNWCFATKPTSSSLVLNLDEILLFKCPRCGRHLKNKTYWHDIDGVHMCQSCAEDANYCEISGLFTFHPLVPLVNECGETIEVHESVSASYQKCSRCNKHTMTIENTEIGVVCKECFTNQFSYCDHGQHFALDEETTDVGEFVVCKQHLKDFMNSDEYYTMIHEQMEINND